MRNRWPTLALLCALASLLVPGIASASAGGSAENRVWAFDLAEQVHVAGQRALTLELHQGCELAEYDCASGSLLAPNGGGRGKNKLQPDPDATGPHSTWKTDGDGNVTGHAQWDGNGNRVQRTDVTGNSHGGIDTPHTHEYGPPNTNPKTGQTYPGNEVNVRPATPEEIPNSGGG